MALVIRFIRKDSDILVPVLIDFILLIVLVTIAYYTVIRINIAVA